MERQFYIDVPMELIAIILSISSVKTLLRFRCVCKRWYELIRNPRFISMHCSAHRNHNLAIISKHSGQINEKDTILRNDLFRWDKSICNDPFKELILGSPVSSLPENKFRPLYFQGSCDGLVCCFLQDHAGEVLPYIWNPSIKKFKEINNDPHNNDNNTTRVYGVGKSIVDDEYKVVRFSYTDEHKPAVVDVYTVSTSSWKRIKGVKVVAYIKDYPNSCVYISGVLYWLGRKSRKNRKHTYVIVSFDLQSEVSKEIMLSPKVYNVHDRFETQSIANLKESLALFSTYGSSVSIWVMKDYGEVKSWDRLYSFSLHRPTGRLSKVLAGWEPVYFGSNGFLVDQNDERLLLFDYELQKWLTLEDNEGRFSIIFNAIDYTESLALI